MRKRSVFAAAVLGVVGVAPVTAALAADLYLKALPAPAASGPPVPPACTSVDTFFLTNCTLSWYGVTVYGTIDVGAGWESHGAPFNRLVPQGVDYFVQKPNRSPGWLASPNGLSQSSIGIKGVEPLSPGWSFVFDLQAGFDPYSLEFANGPGSVFQNSGRPASIQTSLTDSNRNGTFYNGLGYFGVSSPTYGTLTFFRQTALTLDGVLAYDPMGGSYAFSPIGWQGVTCGVGDTEDCRVTTAAKYNVAVGRFRAAGLAQMGGYKQANGADAQYQVSLGTDIPNLANGVLALDGIYSYVKDGVNLTVAGAAPFPVTATISDNTSVMLLGKYTNGPVRLYAGYEWIRFAPPSDPQTAFVDIAGDPIGKMFANNTAINNTAYGPTGGLSDRIMQIVWTGVKYAIADNLDVTGAYYRYDQNTFTAASCANRVARAQCSGTMDAYSAMVNWKFAAKFDAGFLVSQVNGGLANGYVARNNFAPTAGLRFRF